MTGRVRFMTAITPAYAHAYQTTCLAQDFPGVSRTTTSGFPSPSPDIHTFPMIVPLQERNCLLHDLIYRVFLQSLQYGTTSAKIISVLTRCRPFVCRINFKTVIKFLAGGVPVMKKSPLFFFLLSGGPSAQICAFVLLVSTMPGIRAWGDDLPLVSPADVAQPSENILRATDVLCLSAVTIRGLGRRGARRASRRYLGEAAPAWHAPELQEARQVLHSLQYRSTGNLSSFFLGGLIFLCSYSFWRRSNYFLSS